MTKSFVWHWLPLLLILAVAGAIRGSSIDDSLWIDELHTSWIVAGNFEDIAPRAMIGNQSPLAYWLLWTGIQVGGLSEHTLRLPMLLAGLGAIAVGYGLVLRWTGSLSGAIAAGLLIAIEDKCVFYSVEARVYALVHLAALGHIGLFVSLLQAPSWWRRVAWVLLGALMLHLHYTTGLLLIAEWTGYGLTWWLDRKQPHYRWSSLAIDSGLMVLALVPMLGHVIAIAERRQNWTKFIRPTANPLTIFFIIPIAKLTLAPALLLLLFPPISNAASQAFDRRWDIRQLLPICGVWMLAPVLIAWVLSYSGIARLYYPPYLTTAMCAPMVVAGLLAAAAGRGWQRGVIASVVVMIGLLGNTSWRAPLWAGRPAVNRNEPWRTAVNELNAQLEYTPKPVFIGAGFIECDSLANDGQDDPLLHEYCYLPVRSCYWLNYPDDQIHPLRFTRPGQLSSRDTATVSRSGSWFLVRSESSEVFRNDVETSLHKNDPRIRVRWQTRAIGNLTLLELSIVD